ncbi:hypothetical protein [Salimicrobium flavidum]|uniref:Uncharacterized protein n=1 Tax=Salimicrobium flavidum TaxID=570947 RepID=A0A1N7J7X0_9BACI|nr:hypothetical protein [Salimicrobium flavidum]SIS45409.1 hypothetical protein SAMN05421687_104102 [Salimicrobium flavidum]
MRVMLELVRVITLFITLGFLGWMLIENIYAINETSEHFSWMGGGALLIFFFVLYRNKLQFTGWYDGEGQKLSSKLSVFLMVIALLLLVTPFLMVLLIN